VLPTPTGPGEVFVVDSMAWFHVGTLSKAARNTKTSSTGLRIVTVFSNVTIALSFHGSRTRRARSSRRCARTAP
jgi:hypothetical protein